ncbi:MAG: sulfotransferase family protein [Thermoguttaceae bacterium]
MTAPSDRVTAATGGYKDRIWIPRFWDGMNVSGWFRLVLKNRFRIGLKKIPMAFLMSILCFVNSFLAAIQWFLFGRKIARTDLPQEPIFIIGHWRSGTTLLHELLVLDSRHTFPNTYACFAPNHYLLTRHIIAPMMKYLLPERRPMDNMPAGWHHPQEDEFAMCCMGLPSPYLTLAFPNEPSQDPEYLTLENVTGEVRSRWKNALLWFLKCLTLADPRRVVLKSPPHTARIKVLLELFPNARFVHIVRDPFVLFSSTVTLWKRLHDDQGVQDAKKAGYPGLEEYVFRTLNEMYAAFDRDRALIPPSHFAEVRYEDLVRDMVGQMRRIYDELDLGEFDKLLPALQKFVASQADYKKNRYQLAPEVRDEIARRWSGYIAQYGYPIPADSTAAPQHAKCSR